MIFKCHHCSYVNKNSWIFPSRGTLILTTNNSTSNTDAWIRLWQLGLPWLTRLLILNGQKKSFKCRATFKQTTALAKELEWRQDCFLPQSVILSTPKTNSSQSFSAEISQSQKCLAAAQTGADESHQNKNTSRMKVCLWQDESKSVQWCLLAACFSLNHKKINDEGCVHVFFFFSWTIKIQSGDQTVHKPLWMLLWVNTFLTRYRK